MEAGPMVAKCTTCEGRLPRFKISVTYKLFSHKQVTEFLLCLSYLRMIMMSAFIVWFYELIKGSIHVLAVII